MKTSSEGERDEGSGDLMKQQREWRSHWTRRRGCVRYPSSLLRSGLEGRIVDQLRSWLGSVSTLPLGIDRERTGGMTITEHNLWLMPVDMWVMFLKPSVSEDNVIVS